MSESIKLMSYEDWMAFPQATRDALTKIGYPTPKPSHIHAAKQEKLSGAEKARRKFRHETCPEPYILVLKETCLCCAHVEVHTIHMAKNFDESALIRRSVANIIPGLPIQRRSTDTYSCRACFRTLMELPKPELVKMLLECNAAICQYPQQQDFPEDDLT
jgi:hypothetical protein